ncbi:MAG: 50S ribosomal protein L4 [Candidatus Binataceae bacterium]
MAERKHREAVKAPEAVKVPLFSAARERVGEIEVAGAVFGRTGDKSILHEAVKMQMANRRSGTASTKTRGFISGGGKKPWRQKGTGRARAGSIRSPIWRHGGTIFGPQPRDYSYKMPKQAWRRALCLALSDRAANGKLVVTQSLELAEPKTKAAKAMLEALGLKHALIVLGEGEETFFRAARNLAAHKVLLVAGLNVYDVLNYDELLMSEPVARAIEARLKGETSKGEAPKGEAR